MSIKLISLAKKFNTSGRVKYLELFENLPEKQKPDAIFIGCSDSRVMPSFFSYDVPGELLMVRNVGNMIPPANKNGEALGDESEAAALEYGINHLGIDDVIVCGHSNCGAMAAIYEDRSKIKEVNLQNWLRHGDSSNVVIKNLKQAVTLPNIDKLSQLNVLIQVENLKTYPIVKERLKENKLKIHAWWFDVKKAILYSYSQELSAFLELK